MTHLYETRGAQVDANGAPYSGALLYFYQTATTTPITVYQDSGKVTPHANPVVADTTGSFPPIYVDTNIYKTVYKTAGGITLANGTFDPVYAPVLPSNSTPVLFGDGSVSAPGISFTLDTNTGFYRIGADDLGLAVGGSKVLEALTTGIVVTGTLKSSGALTPVANDGASLGTNAIKWSDLFLAAGAVTNWDGGTITMTEGKPFANLVPYLTLAGGTIQFPGNTTTLPQFSLGPGTLMTTPQIGGVEAELATYALYYTTGDSSRQSFVLAQVSTLASDFTGTNVNTAQPVFSSAQDTLPLRSGTTYAFEAEYEIDTTGATSNSLGILFNFTGTLGSISYKASATNSAARGTPSAPAVSRSEVATVFNVTAAVAAATQRTVTLRGTMRVTTGGDLTPQFQFSAAPGATPTIKKDSFFAIWPLGTDATVGTTGWK